jgi:hypothetical protein
MGSEGGGGGEERGREPSGGNIGHDVIYAHIIGPRVPDNIIFYKQPYSTSLRLNILLMRKIIRRYW